MQIEATGKSVEIAIQNGLLECGLKREDVEIKVLEQGGLFKNAKVLLIEKTAQPTQEELIENAENNPVVATEVEVSEQETPSEGKVEEKKKKLVDSTRLQERGKEFLLGLVRLVDENAEVTATAGENEVNFAVTGSNLGKLIGFHGENIQAIQILMSALKIKGEGAIRIFLDIDGYKANKNQGIIDLANRVAEQAIKIERNIHLDPMSPYDRRIVHLTLQDREDVTTESTGEGEKRHVVIKPVFKK